ncbi:hypothetical protein ON010_g6559 [Phytophthora cinnamomi]|nr:hypothetical protein ON010_g6559 [Phytophthora cinnamomi]
MKIGILRKRVVECARGKDPRAAEHQLSRVLVFHGDIDAFRDLFGHLESTYAEVDAVFAANGLATMENSTNDVHIREGVDGRYLEFFSNKIMPFGLRDTAEAAWDHFKGVEKHFGNGGIYEKAAKVITGVNLDQPYTIVEDFTKELHSNYARADMKAKQIVRRYVEADRDMIVFVSSVTPVEIKHKAIAGLTYHLRGYAVTKRSSASDPDHELSLLQFCSRVSIDKEPGVEYNPDHARAVVRFIVDSSNASWDYSSNIASNGSQSGSPIQADDVVNTPLEAGVIKMKSKKRRVKAKQKRCTLSSSTRLQQQKKAEILYLRKRAQEMENYIKHLNHGSRGQLLSPPPSSAAHRSSNPLIDDEYRARLHSEEMNRRLREILANQVQLADSLKSILNDQRTFQEGLSEGINYAQDKVLRSRQNSQYVQNWGMSRFGFALKCGVMAAQYLEPWQTPAACATVLWRLRWIATDHAKLTHIHLYTCERSLDRAKTTLVEDIVLQLRATYRSLGSRWGSAEHAQAEGMTLALLRQGFPDL